MELFLVGGAVRDEIMSIQSKDWDFSVVLSGNEDGWHTMGGNDPFRVMKFELERMGFEIFVGTPEFFTLRARGPKGFTFAGRDFGNQTFDFVMARRETDYSDGRRPDTVQPGTLLDDLARRDFTMNAIAKDRNGEYIDPFDGQQDISDKTIRCVGDAWDRIIVEDALRGLRALRFAVTKGFIIDYDVDEVLMTSDFRQALTSGGVSVERIREELDKMFAADTLMSLQLINDFNLTNILFDGTGIRLMPTMKE